MQFTNSKPINKQLHALVDANNFYVSCERVFQPKLMGKPVVVLSNNDGCAIARSNESKNLGIAMGEPYFKFKHLIKKNDIQVLSSNYALYGDFSARIMHIIMQSMPNVLVYSIDEAFIDLTDMQKNYDIIQLCQNLSNEIIKFTGIPVSIGIGATKTLAKVANQLAKYNQHFGTVFYLQESQINTELDKVEINKIWGIGKRTASKLHQLGIYTGLQLKNIRKEILDKNFNIVTARTVAELNGDSVIEIKDISESRKQIVVSRSFGNNLTKIDDINFALANHVATAAEKLRSQQSVAKGLVVFLQTSQFNTLETKYQNSYHIKMPIFTNDTSILLKYARKGINHIFKTGYSYKKTGVLLFDIIDKEKMQLDLFDHKEFFHTEKTMDIIDKINLKMGKFSIKYASQGVTNYWEQKQKCKSPNYTTNWDHLSIVYAK